MVMDTFNPSTRWQRQVDPGQPGQHSETLSTTKEGLGVNDSDNGAPVTPGVWYWKDYWRLLLALR